MSADRWTICPKCAEKKYPNYNSREYMIELDSRTDEGLNDTLREDYEVGTNLHGVLLIDYRCSCYVCGFAFRYRGKTNALKESDA